MRDRKFKTYDIKIIKNDFKFIISKLNSQLKLLKKASTKKQIIILLFSSITNFLFFLIASYKRYIPKIIVRILKSKPNGVNSLLIIKNINKKKYILNNLFIIFNH